MSKFDKYLDNIEDHLEIGEPTFGRTIAQIKREACIRFHCDCPTGEAVPKCQFCGRSEEEHE